jgi:hypothetical protein
METVADITIRLVSAVNRLEYRNLFPDHFKESNQDLKTEILNIQNELNEALKLITN